MTKKTKLTSSERMKRDGKRPILVAVSQAEYERLEKAAGLVGRNVTQFVRYYALVEATFFIENPELLENEPKIENDPRYRPRRLNRKMRRKKESKERE